MENSDYRMPGGQVLAGGTACATKDQHWWGTLQPARRAKLA
jgi:hypothetical protein